MEIVMAEEKESAGAKLFNILKDKDLGTIQVTLTPDEQSQIKDILGGKPQAVLESPEFAQAVIDNRKAKNVLKNVFNCIEELSKEPYGLIKVECAKRVAAESVCKYYEAQTQDKTKPANEQSTEQNASEQMNTYLRKTLTLEQLKEKKYRGTLTAEQQQQLKDEKLKDEKKVANLENVDGDVQKNTKREQSKDKFRDEDVIKYMYEDWFLGGASWLFNKTEDYVLGILDSSLDNISYKSSSSSSSSVDKDSSEIRAKVADFKMMTAANIANTKDTGAKKMAAFDTSLNELGAHLQDPNTPLEHWQKDGDFVKKLKQNPNAQEFINQARSVLKAHVSLVTQVAELSQMITQAEMTDNVMREDTAWRKLKFGGYKDVSKLDDDFQKKSAKRMEKFLEALVKTQEDARLLVAVSYDKLPDPKPSIEEYTQYTINDKVNGFLANIAKQTKNVLVQQQDAIDKNQFDAVGYKKGPGNVVKDLISKIDKEIDDRSKTGALYEDKDAQKRISGQQSLFELAKEENTDSNGNITSATYEKALSDIDTQQAILDSRKQDNIGRRKSVEEVKTRLGLNNDKYAEDVKKHLEKRYGKNVQDNAVGSFMNRNGRS